ncbi:pectinesterase family protein [Pseudoalteromonas sp. JSTW]|uniref:pectinesterase family protein n=1 Tax=Pseudoalteromonas sp. JSTW TaxID=2752475 RepID=UPI0015D54509|nr:pectinesterase family protein [Pseudoalteromonas sp. JSTW]QLJ10062.1 polysaccharide lyase [Pseudoalteromonas sp. JSTW]
MRLFLSLLVGLSIAQSVFAATPAIGTEPVTFMHVEKNNKHAYNSIQAAINASSPYKEVVITVAAGEYNEKLYITRSNLSIVGESAANTIIRYAQLRNSWREHNDSDWGAAVVNITGSDITLANISVINDYGKIHNTLEHQFAIRGFENASRIIFHQCDVQAYGADTVSLWNKKEGLYYHSYCSFTGATDMVCPRGTALIEHSQFYNLKQTATLWHDGELSSEQKFVVANSEFNGVEGFWLGRHHYDAQFYLFGNQFSDNLADKPIFKKTYADKQRDQPNRWGSRYFFANNKAPYAWLDDNFQPKQLNIEENNLVDWVFKGEWQPKQQLQMLKQQLATQNFKTDAFQLK